MPETGAPVNEEIDPLAGTGSERPMTLSYPLVILDVW